MQYRIDKKTGNKISLLGFGSLRFPKKLGITDIRKTEPLILDAVDKGINYFDTGYFYFGSEEALGVIAERNRIRDKIHIATKLPLVLVQGPEDFDKFFNKQLERTKGGYIDYYLIHQLPALGAWKQLCEWGIEQWIAGKKKSGQIRAMGFSFHGQQNEFISLIDSYDWDFCQIQYNYSDENFQAGVTGLKHAAAKDLPVFIMEPLLGGKLASGLSPRAKGIFAEADPAVKPAEWAFRWLWNQPEVTCTLSGMASAAQVAENVAAVDRFTAGMLTDKDMDVYRRVQQEFSSSFKVLCTGCNYCMPCPKGVNIPAIFSAYNTSYNMGRIMGIAQYITSSLMSDGKQLGGAGLCVTCKICEKKCSQNLHIADELAAARKRLEPWWVRYPVDFAGGLFKKFMRR